MKNKANIKMKVLYIIAIVAILFNVILFISNTYALRDGIIYSRDELSELLNEQKEITIDIEDTLVNTNSVVLNYYVNNESITTLDATKDYRLDSYTCNNDEEIVWDIDNKKLQILNADDNTMCEVYFNEVTFYRYTAGIPYYEFVTPTTGNYRIELWGAVGGGSSIYEYGSGGYTAGTISLTQGDRLYFYLGEKGQNGSAGINETSTVGQGAHATYNGGGAGGQAGGGDYPYSAYSGGCSGGGATDVRLVSGTWNAPSSLKSRIMVAGGGGGYDSSGYGSVIEDESEAGGLSGYFGQLPTFFSRNWDIYGKYVENAGKPGEQTTGNAFGYGGTGDNTGVSTYCRGHSGGGGGYYGGTGGKETDANCFMIGGGGGSSFISGHTGCVAIKSNSVSARTGTGGATCVSGTTDNLCSVHYSSKIFSNTLMIDGKGQKWTNVIGKFADMPSPSGGLYPLYKGHRDDGMAIITKIN